jgi:hypothetical protein
MQGRDGGGKLLLQAREIFLHGFSATKDHVIMTAFCHLRRAKPHGFFEAAADAVAFDSISALFGDGKTNTRSRRGGQMVMGALGDTKAAAMGFARCAQALEVSAFFKPHAGLNGLGRQMGGGIAGVLGLWGSGGHPRKLLAKNPHKKRLRPAARLG